MDQNDSKKYDMPWYDWLVFAVPALFIIGLGVESALGPGPAEGVIHRDFRAIAHWFDPIVFQYNLVMALLTVLVVPSLALSYIQTMATRKERRLQHEVPLERRAEVRRRMARRASFSTYRGSVWLTTTVVLLGTSILLLFKPVFTGGGAGVDFSLGANMLTMGPFAELYAKNPDAYYSHLIRNLTAFQFGFLGAYVYFIGAVVRAYFTMDLTSHTFVDGAIRMIVASILALVLSFAYDFLLLGDVAPEPNPVAVADPGTAGSPSPASRASQQTDRPDLAQEMSRALPASLSLLPIVAFFFGFYPKRAALALERIALKVMRNIIPGDGYRALPLSMLAGMSYAHELRLEREGFDNVENLSNADAVDLAVRTCFSYPQLKQWIDQAWLASHLREDYPYFVRRSGLSTGEELEFFLSACDANNLDGVQQLVPALSVEPADSASWKLRLAALKILLQKNAADEKYRKADESEPKPGHIVSLGVSERSP